MKKSLIILSFCFSSTAAFALNNYHVTQKDTKPWGCGNKTQTSTPNETGGNNYDLYCSGSGSTMCNFEDGTCADFEPFVQATNEIRQKVDAGIYSGSLETLWGSYSWEAINNENFTYKVSVR